MRKFFAVLGWIAMAACLVVLVSAAGEKTALRKELRKEKQKYEALKALYDEEKMDWEAVSSGLQADNLALTLEKHSLSAALTAAREEAQSAQAEREILAAEKDMASGRLSEIMAVLMPKEPQEKALADSPDAAPLPAPNPQRAPEALSPM